MLITAHRRCWLPALWACRTSPELLAKLVAALSKDRAHVEHLEDLFSHHRGNVRSMFGCLYELASLDEYEGPDKTQLG